MQPNTWLNSNQAGSIALQLQLVQHNFKLVTCFGWVQELGELDGVCTFCEMAVPLVSRVAETLGLSGNAPDAVDAARDKHSTRAKMAAAGLPTPRNMLVQQPSDLKAAAEMVKFPAGTTSLAFCLKPHQGVAVCTTPHLPVVLYLSFTLSHMELELVDCTSVC